jgi:pyrroline-5-carboxylate reductase
VFDVSKEQMDSCCAKFPGVKQTSCLHDLMSGSNVVIIGVKPQNVEGMMRQLKDEATEDRKLGEDTVLVSIVAGIPLQAFQRYIDLKSATPGRPRPAPCPVRSRARAAAGTSCARCPTRP